MMLNFFLLTLILFTTIGAEEEPRLLSLTKVWGKADHNAFTDLIQFKNNYYLVFRESTDHAADIDGTLRVLQSSDGQNWKSVAHIESPNIDLRDPAFSIHPDGRLQINSGGSLYVNGELTQINSFVSFSEDGVTWTTPEKVIPDEWLWRVSWQDNIGYGIAYKISDYTDLKKPWSAILYKTADGLSYEKVADLNLSHQPSEATIRFQSDGTAIALMRSGRGLIGQAKPPYTDWVWHELLTHLGGPNFVILPSGSMWGASRILKVEESRLKGYTAVAKMTLTSYQPELILPSGGDTGYPGLLYKNGTLWVSYYSSHEGKSQIYLAKILLPSFDNFLNLLDSRRVHFHGAGVGLIELSHQKNHEGNESRH